MESRRPTLTQTLMLLALALGSGLAISGCPSESRLRNAANTAQSGSMLTAAEVDQLLLRAISQANSTGQSAAIAVVDREGEVLGVFLMAARDVNGDGIIDTPGPANVAAAISKAATAAAFQSEGEAFTTRTAYFIVQGNFPPPVRFTAGGPLFGVQDSGMPNSDAHIIAFDQDGNATGAGITGELGGVPLYKFGAPVGGIGVDTVAPVQTLSGQPTLVVPIQDNVDERIARAGASGFEAPSIIQATNVFVDGQALPFYDNLSTPLQAPTLASIVSAIPVTIGAMEPNFPIRASPLGAEIRVSNEYGIRPSARFIGRVGAASSVSFLGTLTNIDRPASVAINSATLLFTGVPILNVPSRVVSSVQGEDRYTAIDSLEPLPGASGLTAAEVNTIIAAAVNNARSSVAGIRLPRGSSVTVHVAVVDLRGNILGLYRMADGTLFSSDIAVQKARTAAFFSTDSVAFTARAIGFLSQPYFPPGIDPTPPGPLARIRDIINRGKITQEVIPSLRLLTPPPRLPSDGTTDEDPTTAGSQTFDDFAGAAPAELASVRAILAATGGICLTMDRTDTTPNFISPGLQSGLMTFPGSVPLYRNGRLIGAVGVSGDGVDEDDAASFAGGNSGFPAPIGIRCDEQGDGPLIQVLIAKLDLLVTAIQAHPDPRIRNVYGPIMAAERDEARRLLNTNGLRGIRIPYVKLPRNPSKF
ncbi:MAG: heme-binding protein [Planctomycetes bacterium]|nr:heme-binding protein [Planctomycetota bacterium]